MSYSLEAMLGPISEKAPAGVDVRYFPEFDRLQLEIDKRNSVTSPMKTDWGVVADLAATIMTTQGKDLLVAAYFANAQCYLHGLQGFIQGVELLDACCKEYWSSMFPREGRIQGRINAVNWWMENSGNFLRTGPQLSLSLKEAQAVIVSIEGLDTFLQEKNAGFPSLVPLVRLLKKLKTKGDGAGNDAAAAPPVATAKEANHADAEPTKPVQPKRASSPTRKAAPNAVSGSQPDAPAVQGQEDGTTSAIADENPAPVSPVTSDEDCTRAETQLHSLAWGICSWQLQRSFHDPYYFYLNRITAWGTLADAPQHVSGRTDLAPADASFRELLHDLREQATWETLLYRSELMLRAHPYWLDLCRFADESLAALGESFSQIREICSTLTALFVQRFPGVHDLSYVDGTPFADEVTKEWLQALVARRQGNLALTIEDRINRVREQALADIRGGDVLKASSSIETCMEQAASPAERLHWRILLAQMLNEADQTTLARMHFDILLELVDRHGLEEWDKEMALAVLCAAYKGMHALESENLAEMRAALLKRVSRIAPSVAVQLGKA